MMAIRDWASRHHRLLILLALTIVTYLAALNRTQVLLWSIAALLLAGVIVGTLLPMWLVKQVTMTRVGPTITQEDASIELGIQLSNSSWAPRFMLKITDHLPFLLAAAEREVVLGHVPFLPGRGKRSLVARMTAEKRGRYVLGPAGIASSFPLGIVEHKREMDDVPATLTVYPNLFPIADIDVLGSLHLTDRGLPRLPEAKGNADFTSLREYQRGDPPKHIHWPSTARNNKLMVREFEAMANATLWFVLDCSKVNLHGVGKHTTFEYAVKIAGSMAQTCSRQRYGFALRATGTTDISIDPGYGEAHFSKVLDALAVVQADSQASYASVIEQQAQQLRPGDTLVLFASASNDQLQALGKAVMTATDRKARLFVVVFDRYSFGSGTQQHEPAIGALQALGAVVVFIHRGSDLGLVFNA